MFYSFSFLMFVYRCKVATIEKISIINSKNKIVKTSSNSFLVSIAIFIFILYLNISVIVNILLILLFIFSILKYIKIKKYGNYVYNYYKNQL
jgi:hypothetical protein